ncbi:MAG TPA: DUF1501 domain-containing protein, partial [Bryobacteraceae bacterium]|nr:DUF1501 domain-containing protein [Bryobacteraceae bacterium]
MKSLFHHWPVRTRREFFTQAGSGLAGLALSSMLAEGSTPARRDPMAPREPHHKPGAKSVIFLFMEGGPSHIDLFDPKPKLNELNGQPLPPSFGKIITAMGTGNNSLLGSPRKWQQHGKSGTWVSDWYPHIAQHVDDIAVIRSCWADGLNHVGSVCQMNTGAILAGRPSMGAWVTYGLGSANRNLPTFLVLVDQGLPLGGAKTWSGGFLPAVYQGTLLRQGDQPILHLLPPKGVSDEQQRAKLSLLKELNTIHAEARQDDSELDARLRSYELAYQMQAAGPEAVDIAKESEQTKDLYGMNDPDMASFGRNCLLARRLVERGVRFVEVYCGSGSGWDAHANIEANHGKWCRVSDKPIAGLLTDLNQRGLLDETLVVWGGEFGR